MTLSISEFRQKISDTRVECRECGFKAHSVAGHVIEVHGMEPAAYKEKHGKDAKLASRLVAEMLRTMPREAQRTADLGHFAPEFTFIEIDLEAAESATADWSKLVEALPKVSKDLKALVPGVDAEFALTADLVKPLVYAMQEEENVYLSGPTGCGKTDGVLQVLGRAAQPVVRVNMNGEVTYRNFIGSKEAEGGDTRFEHGFLPRAMMGDGKRGYPIILDEIDYTPPHIAALLNPVMEVGSSGRTLYIPDTNETIRANPGFYVIATANTGGRGDRHGHFTGTEMLNTAFLDRFPTKLSADYLGPDVEMSMLQRRFPKAKAEEIQAMVQGAAEIRRAFKEGEIGITLSTRKLIDFFKKRRSFTAAEALDVCFLNWTDEDDGQLAREMLQRAGVAVEVNP